MGTGREACRRCLVASLALVILLTLVAPVSAQSDLATLGAQMERAWNSANWPAALALLDHMRTLVPSDEGLIERELRGRLNYGWDLISAGLCTQARTQFERALGLLPGDAEALAGLALTQVRCPNEAPPVVPTPVRGDATPTRVLPTPAPAGPSQGARQHTVRRGDTLYSLARHYGVTVEQIQRANGLRSDAIQVGVTLQIPAEQGADQAGRHTVEAGDTPAALARRYGTTVEAIRQANGLTGDAIRAGMVLSIPAGDVHMVRAGETLYSIARQYGITVADLMAANGLSGSRIRVGQQLRIPGAAGNSGESSAARRHTVQAGETLFSIAREYGTTVAALQAANGLAGSEIHAGMELTIR